MKIVVYIFSILYTEHICNWQRVFLKKGRILSFFIPTRLWRWNRVFWNVGI